MKLSISQAAALFGVPDPAPASELDVREAIVRHGEEDAAIDALRADHGIESHEGSNSPVQQPRHAQTGQLVPKANPNSPGDCLVNPGAYSGGTWHGLSS